MAHDTPESEANNEQSTPGGESPAAESGSAGEQDPADRLAELESELDKLRDQALRAQAEAENTRRRTAREVENAHKYALEKFVAELLPVMDSLEKAVETARAVDGADAIADGVELSLKLALSTLEKAGVRQVDPLGAPFDPQEQEAMAMVPSPDAEPNTVIDVMQKGYTLNGRLVRAAMVAVARAPDPG